MSHDAVYAPMTPYILCIHSVIGLRCLCFCFHSVQILCYKIFYDNRWAQYTIYMYSCFVCTYFDFDAFIFQFRLGKIFQNVSINMRILWRGCIRVHNSHNIQCSVTIFQNVAPIFLRIGGIKNVYIARMNKLRFPCILDGIYFPWQP